MENRRTKKNISNTSLNPPKLTKSKVKDKKKINLEKNDLIESLLNKNKKPKEEEKFESAKKSKSINLTSSQPKGRQTKSKKDKIIQNFHHAINSTKSDQIIVKMLELKENDIINFYSNLEKMIGNELSKQIRDQMSKDIDQNTKSTGNTDFALCPFCCENKSNCVILLCGHLICHKCGKNINRCKYPCPKCKKPIKYIQYIVD
tara:strand:+ start:594 stop:1202 length:609 start_codon:yes stop_codon:yes gene_type:complete